MAPGGGAEEEVVIIIKPHGYSDQFELIPIRNRTILIGKPTYTKFRKASWFGNAAALK